MKFNSIKFEISILYTAILGLILIAFSGVFYLISQAFLEQTDQQLLVKAQVVSGSLRSYLDMLGDRPEIFPQAAGKMLSMRTENFLSKTSKLSQKWVNQAQALNIDKEYVNVVSKDAKEAFSSINLDKKSRVLFLENAAFPSQGQITFWSLNLGYKNIRIVNYPLVDKGTGESLIQVGTPQDPINQQLHNWLYSIAISVPLILILTNFVGRLLANRILKPVYEITNIAKGITQHDLSARIKSKHFDREMATLIESFNDMIDRLEHSFKHVEQFSYHAAHELKTPLTIIQGEANLLLRRERTVQEYKQALQIIMEESQRVLKTVDDLLLLTKVGYAQEVFKLEDFDFIEFFNEIIDQNRLFAANKGIGIRMNYRDVISPVIIKADRLHLRRLFFNILDNAIKYTSEGGCVDLRLERQGNKIVSFISDDGPGISQEDLDKIFERFYRADKNKPGSGLGLSIAYTIAKVHGGDILVESQVGRGTTFSIVLPVNP